jgi:hypothetical protein
VWGRDRRVERRRPSLAVQDVATPHTRLSPSPPGRGGSGRRPPSPNRGSAARAPLPGEAASTAEREPSRRRNAPAKITRGNGRRFPRPPQPGLVFPRPAPPRRARPDRPAVGSGSGGGLVWGANGSGRVRQRQSRDPAPAPRASPRSVHFRDYPEADGSRRRRRPGRPGWQRKQAHPAGNAARGAARAARLTSRVQRRRRAPRRPSCSAAPGRRRSRCCTLGKGGARLLIGTVARRSF